MIQLTVEYRRCDGRTRATATTDTAYSPDIADDLVRRATVALIAALDETRAEWVVSEPAGDDGT